MLAFLFQFGVTVALAGDGLQQGNLLLGLEYCFMGPVQVIKVLDQGLDTFVYRKLFQHVLTHEVGKITHGLH